MIGRKNKNRDLAILKKLNPDTLIKVGELSILTGVRRSTLVYYADIGIIPFEQEGTNLSRKFHIKEIAKRLKEIEKLKGKNYSIEQIQQYFNGK